jgi:putative ABC transport system permease protein
VRRQPPTRHLIGAPNDIPRYSLALRSLVDDRSVSAIVILCLALGVLIQPLPFPQADRLVVLNEVSERHGICEAGVSYPAMQDIRERAKSLSTVAASSGRVITLSDREDAELVPGAAITLNLFPTLRAQPILGCTFREDDDRPGAEPVVMLSDEIWQRRYHGDAGVVGRSIKINGKPRTVVGVMPPRFSFPETQKVGIPLGPDAAADKRDARYLFTLARLNPSVDPAFARAELASIASTRCETSSS